MVTAGLVASVLTLPPALAVLWVYLGRYEGHFAQNRLFFALIVGIFAGIVLRFGELNFFGFESAQMIAVLGGGRTGLLLSLLYTALGYAMLHGLLAAAVVGLKRFRTRKDTPYYGASLGLGFGAMWSLTFVEQTLARTWPNGLEFGGNAWIIDLGLLLGSVGLVLAHGAAFTWVGKGAAEGRLWKGAGWGALWLAPALGAYWVFVSYSQSLLPIAGMLAWGAIAILQADKRVLDPIVPPELRDKLRKGRRRDARQKSRE